ncbi:DUF6479 family protein [Streptomyces sp. NPDC048182]|uniref:DUF6479 family protein n=1 Tax=unclassified Streptomyces TaxID=2593676 RepID=UPI0033BA6237
MTNTGMDLAAASGALGIGLIVAGIVVVVLLVGAIGFGSRVKRRESPPPKLEEQPRLPEGGPVREVREQREPDEMPTDEGRKRPSELRHQGSRSGEEQDRPRWDEGSSGSFGSGGSGAR